MLKKFCTVLLFFCVVTNLYAKDQGDLSHPEDNSGERKAWTTRHEIYPYVGGYFGDSLESSLMAGGEYMFHVSRHIGVGVDFGYTKADFSENIFYSQPGFFTNANTYILDATAMFSLPASFRIGKRTIENDFFILAGGGTINLNSSYEPHGFIGGGLKTYFWKPWLAWRTDVRGSFHTTGKPGGQNELDADVMIVTGLSFQLPPRIGM